MDEPPPLPDLEDRTEVSREQFVASENEVESAALSSEGIEPQDEFANDRGDAAAASEDLFPDFDSPAAASTGDVYQSNSSPSPNLADVAAFGNSDLSGGREGPLRYNLFIEGIDTVDVREAFREALTDRKLMWDTDTILRSLRNGQVKIQNVPPTKAYILITRLRTMPVQVRWEQYAVSQT